MSRNTNEATSQLGTFAPPPARQPFGARVAGLPDRLGTIPEAQFLRVKDVAAELQMGLSSVTQLIKKGRLAALNVSCGHRARYRISREALEQFKESCRVAVLRAPATQPVRRRALPPGIEHWV